MTTPNGKKPGVTVTPGRPQKPATKRIMPPMPPVEHDGSDDDFLKFWAEFRAEETHPTKRILGVDVAIPSDLPLYYEDVERRLAESNAASDSEEAVELYNEMLATLFGEGTVDQWKAAGLTGLQLRVLTVWGMLNAQGKETTFEEAGQAVRDMIAEEAEGKLPGPNRATRRKAAAKSSKTPASVTTGRASKRTSRANTGSRRSS